MTDQKPAPQKPPQPVNRAPAPVPSLFAVQQTSQIDSPWTHWFFYGNSGSGKTTAASTFPSPLFLVPAAEGSELTLARAEQSYDYLKIGRDANGNPVKPRAHLDAILKELDDRHRKMREALANGDTAEADRVFPWQTIVFESMTHYCAMLQDEISQNGMQKMDQQRWGMISDHLRSLHSRLRMFDCHVVFTALSKVEGEEKAVEGLPDISGKMARMLPAACDAIGFCECVEGGGSKPTAVYRVHFRQHRVYLARTRFRDMPAVVEDFHFDDVSKFTSSRGAF